jgi:hypothetical protein
VVPVLHGLGVNEDMIRRAQKEKYFKNYMDASDEGLVPDVEAENAAQREDRENRDRELEDSGVKSPFDRWEQIRLERDLFGVQQIFTRPKPEPPVFQ